ncbi:hypothetical protein [Bacillus sp. 7884-1]|uniref:hypothetical protein n=1 Tax=Bacillus sp. 7884-1 TaxID=2021693 RepID=UPI000BA5331B|nr:hypothetical protein [Bacillus sp. 7884-1]PAE37637.1 hypothetical protein CHI06_19990 [Bacillus sp. 7884-1]
MVIPKEITREHVISAITRINAMGIESLNPSTGYDLYYEGRLYPPKEVLQIASSEAFGLEIRNLHGGDQTNNFLIKLGFDIVLKGTKMKIDLNHVKNKRK